MQQFVPQPHLLDEADTPMDEVPTTPATTEAPPKPAGPAHQPAAQVEMPRVSAGHLRPWLRLAVRGDLPALAAFLLVAVYVFGHLLTNPNRHFLVDGVTDQFLFEYSLRYAAWCVTHWHNPFAMTVMNAPLGVNGAGNALALGLGVPLTPITLLFGASASLVFAFVVGMAATAAAWYWLFSRHLVKSRLGAAVAGGLCAFSPAMVSQANAHLQFTAGFAVPLIIGVFLRLGASRHPARLGVLLGLLTVYQALVGEELLLIAALGLAGFLAVLVVQRRDLLWTRLRGTAIGLAVGVPTAGLLLAYPLWYQFAGPQHYHGLPFTSWFYNNTTYFTSFSNRSLAMYGVQTPFRGNVTEQNTFYGWPLLVFAVVMLGWLWRLAVARAAALTAIVFAVLSLGNVVSVGHHNTGVPGPWKYLGRLPLLEEIEPSRLAFVVSPMIGVLLALGAQRIVELAPGARAAGVPLHGLWLGALAAVLIPIAPTPLRAADRPAVPSFFTDGTWRRYVPQRGTVVAAPVTTSIWYDAMNWQVAAGMEFRIAGGYFIGPQPADAHGPAGHGWYGAPPRRTELLLQEAANTGTVPAVGATQQAAARADLAYWQADVVVLDSATTPNALAVKATVDKLVGSGSFVDGVWVWRVGSR